MAALAGEEGVGHRRMVGADAAAFAEARHARGRLTAIERIELLLDPGSAVDIDARGAGAASGCAGDNDGVVTVRGEVAGRPVFVFAKDMSTHRATMAGTHGLKLAALQRLAIDHGAPIVGMFDTAGMRLEAGMGAWAAYGEVVRNSAAAFGVVPQIALVLGPCPGADALLPPLGDFTFMANEDSNLFVSGPEVVKAVTHEELSDAELGGIQVHATKSSLVDGACDNDVTAVLQVRRLLAFLPSNHRSGAPVWVSFDDAARESPSLDTLMPLDPATAYDVKEAIAQVSDEGDVLELQSAFAANVVTGFIRIDGRTVGVVANQPAVLAGVLDGDAARKAARFVRFCDAFGIPVVTFVDVPGFLAGRTQEHGGIARHASALLYAYARANVPMVTVVLGRAFGAAGVAMGSRAIGADRVFAWPAARIGLLDAKGAAALQGHAGDPEREAEYVRQVLSPSACVQAGAVDEVIEPRRTRQHVAQALQSLVRKVTPSSPAVHAEVPARAGHD